MTASRSKVYWFKHNDMEDLERCLKEQEQKDKKVDVNIFKKTKLATLIIHEQIIASLS